MITALEIKERAREFGVPTSTIERDYCQNWLLSALRPINMAFKGGTGIRKVFIENYRFSDDLDFTLLEPVDAGALQAAVSNAVLRVREESGILFEDNPGFRETKTGYKATARFRILNRGSASPVKIDLDLTGPGQEDVLLPVSERPVFHPYSDGLSLSVTSYALEEIMAEKIRSLFQRSRSRDLYDIVQLADRVDRNDVKSILTRKCEVKGVVVDTTVLTGRREHFKALWQVSLGHQMNGVPDFDESFEKMLDEIEVYSQG
ncbi:MAG: nucleotidyl transferase AbiEii/AbiGii toxin family protein [Methanoregula sp.]|jgi:predicted nucleotidyltransferase component of viral defense system|uniref:nucleotidyl transferase AbiEii/AbiGii toxin family protein n=1 Tax=Methanoregula sp. TaxID=2052170 RepID=UPI0025CDBB7C|nr:nucleotidyl transferase AbiEii/AbiGii toxin family protein [Methanoregula sp.]MCK9632113.1 nucleotidyl transferase AbiEii/AbiGii toxin family protein [Methanoregula sp.]